MIRVLEVTLPVFALVFCGFAGQRRGMLPAGTVQGLNAFVFMFALPAMLFRVVALQQVADFAQWRFVAGYLAAALIVFAATRQSTLAFARGCPAPEPSGRSRATAFALNVTHGNVGYLGVPLAIELGRQYVPGMIMAMICDIFVVIGLSIALLEIDRRHASATPGSRGASIPATVGRGLLRSPLVLAIAAGLGWSLAGAPMPKVLDGFTRILGGAAGPCALFAIGASLGDRRIVIDRIVAGLVATKLLAHPLLAALALTAVGCGPEMVAVGVLAASLPGASNSYIIAQRYGVDTRDISAAILVGTFMALATVSAVIWLSGFGTG